METFKAPDSGSLEPSKSHLDPTPPLIHPHFAALTARCTFCSWPRSGRSASLRGFLGCRTPAAILIDGVVGCAPFGAHRACPKTGVIGGVTP